MHGDNRMPILKLELDAGKLTLLTALRAHQDELCGMIEASFSKAIEHLQAQLDREVQTALSHVLRDAVAEAAELAREGLAEELANSMAATVRAAVVKKLQPRK